jgi:hypothetical protein
LRSFFSRLVVLFPVLLLTATISHAQAPRATITFDNQSGNPALVKLIGPTGRLASVPNGRKSTVKVIGGRYHIVTRYGADPKSYTYSKGRHFQVTQTATRYSIITITLHKVADGNYQTEAVSAAEFDQAKP